MWITQKNPMLKLSGFQNLNHPSPYRKSIVSRSFTMIVFSGIYKSESMCIPDCIRNFWLVVCTTKKTFSNVLGDGQVEKHVFTRFLTVTMASHLFCLPAIPINRRAFPHNFSHPLLLFLLQRCVSIVGLSYKEASLEIHQGLYDRSTGKGFVWV